MSDSTFHLGLTMAGAVSAGCYTGGAMDYLLEILDLWYDQKKKQAEGSEDEAFKGVIPPHDVIIDAIGGASAGGMTSSMSVIEFLKKHRTPITKENPINSVIEKNTFYKSWVNMDDDEQARTLEKMLTTGDLINSVPSLLNSKSIDEIADNAFPEKGNLNEALKNLPPYVSKDLELILSLSMLNGIPLEVDFRTPITKDEPAGGDTPRHATWEHFTLGHFKLGKAEEPGYRWLNPFDSKAKQTWLKSTIATGAFPIGLASRYFTDEDFDDEYIKDIAERIVFGRFGSDEDQYQTDQILDELMVLIEESDIPIQTRSQILRACHKLPTGAYNFFGKRRGIFNEIPDELIEKIQDLLRDLPHFIDWSNFKENFAFTAVDGGTINNEPYGEVLGILKGRVRSELIEQHAENQQEDKVQDIDALKHKNFGVVMIDPFPDIAKNRSEAQNDYIDDIGGVAGALVGALINQSRVKRHEIVQELNDPSVKGVIFPAKWNIKTALLNDDPTRPFVESRKRIKHPIACESLRAFGGFLDKSFREHDFFLGRNNARNFFRYYFSLPYDAANPHPLFKNWTQEMIDMYGVRRNHKIFLPIIPDLNVIKDKKDRTEEEFDLMKYQYTLPIMPKVKISDIMKLEDQIENRVKAVLKSLVASKERREYPFKGLPITEEWVKKKYFRNWLGRFKKKDFKKSYLDIRTKEPNGLLVNYGSKKGSQMITKQILILMMKDLESKGLLIE